MKSKEYIKQQLEQFISKFPECKVRCELKENTACYFVEISPDIQLSSPEFIEWENQILDDFMDEYPDEGLCFISHDNIVPIVQVDFELVGIKHQLQDEWFTSSDLSFNEIEENCIFISKLEIEEFNSLVLKCNPSNNENSYHNMTSTTQIPTEIPTAA